MHGYGGVRWCRATWLPGRWVGRPMGVGPCLPAAARPPASTFPCLTCTPSLALPRMCSWGGRTGSGRRGGASWRPSRPPGRSSEGGGHTARQLRLRSTRLCVNSRLVGAGPGGTGHIPDPLRSRCARAALGTCCCRIFQGVHRFCPHLACGTPRMESPGRSPLLAVEARGRQEPELLHCCKRDSGTALGLIWRSSADGVALLG